MGAALFARCGSGSSSPNRSCCGARLTCDEAGAGDASADLPVVIFNDAERSILCFSFTRLSGTSSSPSASSVAGSGIGPSITQRLDSYFVLMKFSILASDGTCPTASLASQYLFALEFPHFSTLCSCSSVHASRSTDLTLLICVPIPLCIPEHRMQMKIPRFQLAHLGSKYSVSLCGPREINSSSRLFLLQSAHVLFPSNFNKLLIVFVFCAARSAAGFGGRRDIFGP